jgi:hypothetical protein
MAIQFVAIRAYVRKNKRKDENGPDMKQSKGYETFIAVFLRIILNAS